MSSGNAIRRTTFIPPVGFCTLQAESSIRYPDPRLCGRDRARVPAAAHPRGHGCRVGEGRPLRPAEDAPAGGLQRRVRGLAPRGRLRQRGRQAPRRGPLHLPPLGPRRAVRPSSARPRNNVKTGVISPGVKTLRQNPVYKLTKKCSKPLKLTIHSNTGTF